eukprot:TRINITY_DN22600_c0_g2_i1.p1 TRINITY_DN22600_c0_g2~~TRINITY_DN22600_c0_g2_i1.p1  ORF type:complete len:340 (-),score=29.43 TRINITY_DN22600_c0_g2_i1:369-1388(-)
MAHNSTLLLTQPSEDSDDDSTVTAVGPSECCGGKAVCFSLCLLLVFACAGTFYVVWPAKAPVWEVRRVTLSELSLPDLFINGATPADTSSCPTFDLCGLAEARDCAKCPHPDDTVDGCICYARSGGTVAPPGTVIQSDHSRCPTLDPCGVASARGCSSCPPDASWINDGCTCRQPLSFNQFLGGLATFASTVLQTPTQLVINFTVVADVVVTNPNMLGATTLPGTLEVYWRDVRIGVAPVLGMTIGPRSHEKMTFTIIVDHVSRENALRIGADVLENHGHLNISVAGNLTANVWQLRTATQISCRVTSDVFHGSKIISQDCMYEAFGQELHGHMVSVQR